MHHHLPTIEPLEARIAPAAISGNLHTVTYTDIDGGDVTVTVSKGDLTGKLIFGNAFNSTGPQQLKTINLNSLQFTGADLTITAAPNPYTGGDSTAHFGFLNAKGVDLGDIAVSGDIGKIVAGDATVTTAAIGKLTLRNLGNSSNVGAPNYVSAITGSVGDVNMIDINNAQFSVLGGPLASIKSFAAANLVGGVDAYSGSLTVTGNLGPVTVNSIHGGSGSNSGQISVGGNLESLRDYNQLGGAADSRAARSW